MKDTRILAMLAATSSIALSTATAPAFAQEAAPPAAVPGTLEEIVVNANKRAENIQDVPVSVSAVSSDELAAIGISSLANLSQAVPSISFGNGNGYLTTYLRGVGSQGNGPGFENPIALYVDGVYYENQSVGLFAFNNIAQIEVDKGPQGTLFGRNATGGLIQVTTDDPTQDFVLKASVNIGNYAATQDNLYIAGGILPDLAADLAISGSRHDGWGTNAFNGQPVYAEPYNLAIRSKWVYTPDDWKITLVGDYSTQSNSNNAFNLVSGSRTLYTAGAAHYPSPWDTDLDSPSSVTTTDLGVSVKVQRDFDAVSISNLSAYRSSRFLNDSDYDATPLPVTGLRLLQDDWQFSNELQATSNAAGPLKWTTGIYYFRARSGAAPIAVAFPDSPIINPSFPVKTIFALGKQDTEALAGYGQATYALTDTVDLTGGFRYSYEDRVLNGSESATLFVPGNPRVILVPETHQSAAVTDPTYRVALDYKPVENLMLYASLNTGFKSGGFNVTSPNAPYYKPEKITAYEAGEKADFLNRHLQIDSEFFYYLYKDIQLQVAQEAGTGFTNGGDARMYGVDTNLTVRPVGDLLVKADISLLNAKYTNYPDALTGASGGGVPVVTASAEGNNVPHAPRATFSVTTTYPIHLQDGDVTLTGNYYHNTGFDLEADNVVTQSAYGEFNASIQWMTSDGQYSVLLYGKNLTDAVVKSAVLTIPEGDQIQLLEAPRTFGLTLSYAFTAAAAPQAYAPPPSPPAAPAAAAPSVAAPEEQREFQVFFDFDKSNISEEAAKVLQAAADVVKHGNIAHVTVTGHTDTVGTAAYNQALSQRRADAVRTQLVADGVSSEGISVAGVGKSGLLVPTADGVREPQNRRAVIVLQ